MKQERAVPCPTCGRIARRQHWPAEPSAPSDLPAFIAAWWRLAGAVAMPAGELLMLADRQRLFRGAFHGSSEHGRRISFACRVLVPLVDQPFTTDDPQYHWIIRRLTQGRTAFYWLDAQ